MSLTPKPGILEVSLYVGGRAAVPGVAKVTVFGGEVRQLQVQAKPDRLIAFGLTIQDVLNAAREATGVRGAGFIDTGEQRIVIRTEGQALTPEALGDVVVAHHGSASVRLADVATVVSAPLIRPTMVRVNKAKTRGPAVLISLTSKLLDSADASSSLKKRRIPA